MMIKYYYPPDGDWCYRALHTAHAVFHRDGKLIARAEKPDGSELYEFEITGFELIGPPGEVHV